MTKLSNRPQNRGKYFFSSSAKKHKAFELLIALSRTRILRCFRINSPSYKSIKVAAKHGLGVFTESLGAVNEFVGIKIESSKHKLPWRFSIAESHQP